MHNPGKPHFTFKRLAVALLLLWLCLHFLWRLLDYTPLVGDPILYGIGALNILRSIHLPWKEFFLTLNDATETLFRPPGASILLTPWVWLFDADWRWVKAATVVWHGLMFCITYRLGRQYFSKDTAFLAGVYLISLPLIYAIEINPEVYFLTLVPLALLCASHLGEDQSGNWRWWLGLGVVIALGLLCKWVFAIYMFGPLALLGVVLGHKFIKTDPARQADMAGKLFILLVPVLAVILLWYWPNWDTLWDAFQFNRSSLNFTPFKSGWNWAAIFFYPSSFIEHCRLIPSLFLFAGLLFAVMPNALYRRLDLEIPTPEWRQGMALLLASVAGFWLYFAIRFENIPVKYMFPILPLLALIAVGSLDRISLLPLRQGCIYVLFGYALFCALWIHFGPMERQGGALPRSVLSSRSLLSSMLVPKSYPPHREKWPHRAIVEQLESTETETNQTALITVLPDLYYFDWQSLKLDLRAHTTKWDAMPLDSRKGLEWLHESQYILSCKGRVTRQEYDPRSPNPELNRIITLARFIDRAPSWFWEHYELAATYAMPYDRQELQLFRLRKPHDDISTAGWCGFWVAFQGDDPATWRQIITLWRKQKNQKKALFAEKILKALEDNDRDTAEWLKYVSLNELFPYEQLQLGCWLLNNGEPEKGKQLLGQIPNDSTLCRWKAYNLLSDHLMAWQTDPERPETILALAQNPQEKVRSLYQSLYPDVLDIFMQNRRPTGYQNAARMLLEAKDYVAAHGYARQAWGVGLNRINNTIWLHKARKALLEREFPLFDLPDYERMYLPAHDWFITPPERNFHLKTGESVTFPFLNLEEGVHSLHWKRTLATEQAVLRFTLDTQLLSEEIYTQDQNEARFVFTSPAWKDRLRIDVISGELELREPELIKIQMDGPGQETWSIKREGRTMQIKVPAETDPRAWDYVMLWGTVLDRMKGRIVYKVQEDLDQDEYVSSSFTIKGTRSNQSAFIQISPQMRLLPFLTEIQIEIEDAEEGVKVDKIGFCREEYIKKTD